MKSWWVSPLILALSFGGYHGYQWYKTPKVQTPASSSTEKLARSMTTDPAWRFGRNEAKCIVHEKGNLVVHEDGRVTFWNKEGFFKIFSGKTDRDLIAQTYPLARAAIEGRLIAKVFEEQPERTKEPILVRIASVQHYAEEIIASIKETTEVPELLPMPTTNIGPPLATIQSPYWLQPLATIQLQPLATIQSPCELQRVLQQPGANPFPELLKTIAVVKDPRKRDRAVQLYWELLEALDLLPE